MCKLWCKVYTFELGTIVVNLCIFLLDLSDILAYRTIAINKNMKTTPAMEINVIFVGVISSVDKAAISEVGFSVENAGRG